MVEILKEWLSDRLNQPIVWEADEFVNLMRDGHLLARLLLSYKVINDEQRFLIRPAVVDHDAKANWKHLTVWLSNIDVHLTDSDVKQILEGRGSALLRLFYQLFLQLDKKDRTDFIKRERKLVSNLVTKIGGRFNVEKVDAQEIPVIDYLAKPLADEKFFIEWQKAKSDQLKQTYDQLQSHFRKSCKTIENAQIAVKRERFQKPFKFSKEKCEIDKFEKNHPCKFEHHTYEELVEMDERVKEEAGKNILDEQWAKDYLSHLQSKSTNTKVTKEFQKQMRLVISDGIWEQTIGEEEDQLDKDLAEKVMKLSHFEKQMCTQLMETKQQARNLIKNRMDADKEISAQREQQFTQYLDDLKHEIHSELVEIDFETQRQNELHEKLYAEKMKRKRQHYYEICYDTMLSILDYSVKYAYTKLLTGSDIPPHFIREWKNLYFKQQPIFDIVEDLENILTVNDTEDPTEIEDIVHLELDRQYIQNENDFLDYHNESGSWQIAELIANFDPESTQMLEEYLGLRVLGHVVYKLLETKYPLPPIKLPAELPKYTYKAILRCLPDRSMTIPVQVLLSGKKINVVRVESAINYCLKTFKTEMIGCKDINLSFDKFIAAAPESDRDLIKLLKTEDETTENEQMAQIGVLSINVKQTQTPKTIPEEDIVLSPAADLGQYAYELLCGGEALTDHLISAILVEYLKTIKDINGFVLINFPNSYNQAQILEEILLGRGPPHVGYLDNQDDVYLEQSMIKLTAKTTKDIYESVRISKLVPDPHKVKEVPPFISYFTSYIHLKESLNILEENFIWDLNENNSEIIDRFYASQYINYSIYYELIDKDVLALICKYIIGDFTLPFKDSDSLFGLGVLSALEFPHSDDKRQKSKVLKPDSSKTNMSSKKNKKNSKLAIASKDRIPADSPIQSDQRLSIDENTATETNEILEAETENPSTPGEENWQYADLPLDDKFSVVLATVWEEAEHAYINDLQNLFFATRLQINNVVPYSRFAQDKVEQIITRPSEKQELVVDFQRKYNDYEEDWLFTDVAKVEWHCRVKEFQKILYNICDTRKKDALSERQRLIHENWTMEEATAMVNTYISCMQSELNRATLTYQLLHDFYFMMLKRPPSTDRLASIHLTKIEREPEVSPRKRSGDDKQIFKLKSAYQEMHMRNISIDEGNNPHNYVLENNMKAVLKTVNDLKVKYEMLIAKEYTEASKVPTIKTKKTDVDTGAAELLEEEYVRMQSMKCLEEWKVAVEGESLRIAKRMQMLLGKAYVDLKLMNDYMSRTFLRLQREIDGHYLREIDAVDRLCEYIQLAVERSERIRPTLVLEQDQFAVIPDLERVPPPPPSPRPLPAELPAAGEFCVAQLVRLRERLRLVAPAGLALEPTFVYLLQDFLLYGKESCDGPLLPAAWQALEPEQIPELVLRVHGEAPYVDWRDFLVSCLDVPFPSVAELLELRRLLRCADREERESIAKEDFMKIELWFEADQAEDPSVLLRIEPMKAFLFDLFEIAPDVMNTSALLLALCRSEEPEEGFAAAVSVAVGERVCGDLAECGSRIFSLIELKQYNDACRACALDCADKFTTTLIDQVIDYCEGTIITEVPVTQSYLELEKKKGKLKSPKDKAKREKSTTKISRTAKQKSLQIASTPESKREFEPSETVDSQRDLTKDLEEKLAETEDSVNTSDHDLDLPTPPAVILSVSPAVIMNILEICLPWHFKTETVEKESPYRAEIVNVLERLGEDTENGDVFVAKFLNEDIVHEILHKVNKFKAVGVLDIAANIFSEKVPPADD